MSKQALVDQMRQDHSLTSADAGQAVSQVFESLEKALHDKERIAIPGFGIFRVKHRDRREVRNPRTGQKTVKEAHTVITFKESKSSK